MIMRSSQYSGISQSWWRVETFIRETSFNIYLLSLLKTSLKLCLRVYPKILMKNQIWNRNLVLSRMSLHRYTASRKYKMPVWIRWICVTLVLSAEPALVRPETIYFLRTDSLGGDSSLMEHTAVPVYCFMTIKLQTEHVTHFEYQTEPFLEIADCVISLLIEILGNWCVASWLEII